MKKIAQNAALAAVSLAVLLVLLEVALRIALPPAQTISVSGLGEAVPGGDDSIVAEGTPDRALYVKTSTGLRLRKKSRAVIKNHSLSRRDIEIRTNSHGYRYDELGEKGPGDFRILVLGDSITFGDYVGHDETYPAVIEAYLKEHTPPALEGKNIQVINAGIGSIDLQNEFAILMESGLSVKPDVVLVGLYLNDAYQSLNLRITRPPGAIKKSRLAFFIFNRFDALKARYGVEDERAGGQASMKEARKHFLLTHKIKEGDWSSSEEGFNWLIFQAFYDWGYS